MNRIRTVLAGLIGLVGVGVLAGRPLTIDDCLRLGLENNPSLVSSRAGVELADARKREAIASRLPSLKLTSSYAHLNPEPPFVLSLPAQGGKPPVPETIIPAINDNAQLKLTLQQPIFTGFRLSSATAIAADNADAARNDYAQDRAQLIYNIKNSYWRLAQALQSKKIVEQNIERMESHLTDIKNQQSQGLATRNDVLKVEVQLANARLTEIDADNGVKLTTAALDNLIGLPLVTEIDPVSSLDDSLSLPATSDSIPDLIAIALARRPEVKALATRVKARAEGVRLARSAWFPQIMASGDYYYALPNQRQFPQQDKFTPSWDIGIGLSLNIWDWGTAAHQTAEAGAQLRQAEASLTTVKNSVSLEVTQDFLSLFESRQKVKVAQTALAQAEENQRVAQAGFKVGAVLTSDLLDAEANLLQAELNLTQARTDQEICRAKLEKTLGAG